MNTEFNTDLQSTLNSVKSQLSSLGAFNGANGTSSDNYVNSVWGLVQNGEAAINGNDQQKAQAISDIVSNLMSMLTSLGTNENSKATQEVNKNDKKSNDLNNKANDVATDTQTEIESIVNDIATNSSSISDAIDKIEKLGGSEDDIKAAKEKLDEQIQIVEENLAIVNDGVSSLEAKENALALIKGASAEITNIASEMNILTEETQSQIQEQNAIVENSTEAIAGLMEKSLTAITNGTSNLQSFVQQATQEIIKNTMTSTTGAANEVVGATATATGSASSWIPVLGQTASSKLIQIGADQTAAGGTRIAGSVKTLASLTSAIGKMGSDISAIAGQTGNIQGVGNGAIDLVGNYQTKLDSIITATGSWSQVVDANTELDAQVEKAEGKNESKNFWEQMSNSKTQNFDMLGFGVQNSDKQASEKNSSQGVGVIDFDVNRFKVAFGI